jgi:cystathionine gamma-synthase
MEQDPSDTAPGGSSPAAAPLRAQTWVVSAGRPHQPGDPLNVPMVPASNFLLPDKCYSREDATPGWEALETIVGGLEGGHCVSFASGMAAAAAVFASVPVGARVVLPTDCYQAVAGIAAEGAQLGRWELVRLDGADTAAWIDACAHADLIWIESPSNPLLTVSDLAAICAAPRRPGALLAVDGTFATPLNQRPLALGADVSMHSVTKYLGGHSDLLLGVLSVRDSTLLDRFRHQRVRTGATPGTLEAFLAVRGVRTLALRLERAQASALELARRLQEHPRIEQVRYPGLPDHPTHAAAAAQMDGFGAVVSFDVAGGAAAADAVCAGARLIRHATSLGGVESTMERRAVYAGQSHLPAGLVRLSVGIEHVEDLWADLAQALGRAP